MGCLTGKRAAYTEAALTLQWECRLRSQPPWLSLSAHLAVSVRAPSSPTVRYLIILYTQHVPILPSPLPVRYVINIINYIINIHRYSRYLIGRASYREVRLRINQSVACCRDATDVYPCTVWSFTVYVCDYFCRRHAVAMPRMSTRSSRASPSAVSTARPLSRAPPL